MNIPEPTKEEALRYCDQIAKMKENRDVWRKEHPNEVVLIQWPQHEKLLVVAALSDAVAQGLVAANEAGRSLLMALWPWHVRLEPTVTMAMAALDALPADDHPVSEMMRNVVQRRMAEEGKL